MRVLELARHELAVAFRNAQLRAALELERLELTAIVDGATDAIVEVDAERRILRLNRAALELLGERHDETVGRTCGEALQCARAGGHAEEACPLAEVIRTGQPIRLRTTALIGVGGAVVPMVAGYARVAGSDGPRATAILRDMRDVRALEELREGFVATVSHELRTPLALVKGYAESLLLLELDPAERRRYLERIDQLADRLRTLVTEILDVTQLQADPLVLERTPVQLAALVTRLSADLAVSGGADRLMVELPPDLPAVEVDPIRIGQVLENLVGNAAKYAPGTGSIRLSASASPPGWLDRRDRGRRDRHSGCGPRTGDGALPSGAQCPRVEHRRNGPRPGHLAPDRGGPWRPPLARAANRWSTRDVGPVHAAAGADAPANGLGLRRLAVRRVRRPGRRRLRPRSGRDRSPMVAETVLIVEDEPEFAALLELWVRTAGYEPVVAATGNDALRQFYESHPDLVLLDLSLPGLDGWQVLERIREFSRVPILMVTARSGEADKIRGLKLGADDYITKPMSLPELLARVEAALRRAASASPERPRRLRNGALVVDIDEHRAYLNGDEIRLTPTEFRLLAYLVEHAGQLVTHRQVLGSVWGAGYGEDMHLLRMTIRNLRLKLEAVAPGSSYIGTEYGLGYRLLGGGDRDRGAQVGGGDLHGAAVRETD